MKPGVKQRVGILFSGGPAPAANAVISAAAASFLEADWEVVGIFHGYSHLMGFDDSQPLVEDQHYRRLTEKDMGGMRNQRGIALGTSRAGPGRGLNRLDDLTDGNKTAELRTVLSALRSLNLDAFLSIGGDGSLGAANLLYLLQQREIPDGERMRIVHLPKTIDNDYHGIDFTFGYFTAVDVMSGQVLNLRADAKATSSYFIVETMGRKAGWLAYGVGMTGEANLVVATEDIEEALIKRIDGQPYLCLEKLAGRIVEVVMRREAKGKHYGTVVVAEGLAGHLPPDDLGTGKDSSARSFSHAKVRFSQLLADEVCRQYGQRTGRVKKVTAMQLGYEARSAAPNAFDVMLASQLGIGGYRAVVEEGLTGTMVSVEGQLELKFVPFADLIDPATLKTHTRFIQPGSDFHRMARFLETRGDYKSEWNPGRRIEHNQHTPLTPPPDPS